MTLAWIAHQTLPVPRFHVFFSVGFTSPSSNLTLSWTTKQKNPEILFPSLLKDLHKIFKWDLVDFNR